MKANVVEPTTTSAHSSLSLKKSAIVAPTVVASSTPVKKSVTYDDILANMGLCVYNGKLQQLEQGAIKHDLEKEAETKIHNYPHINKKARNIPQRDYIYTRLNKYLQPTQPPPPPTPLQIRNQLIQKIVDNKIAAKQNKNKRHMMFY